MNSRAYLAIFTVLLGCGLNNVFLEYIIKLDPGSGHLITFLQFLYIAIHGFVFISKFGTEKRVIPFKDYFILVALFYLTSVINNWAFDFNIPVPLHMIFRSGSLIASLILGVIILKKQYSLGKYISVIMITVGIAVCILSSNQSKAQACTDCDVTNIPKDTIEEDSDYGYWQFVGITLLTVCLFLSASMGICQESIYSKYGKRPNEVLYYTHLFSLPGFLINAPNIWEHATDAKANTEIGEIPYLNIVIPVFWTCLILNVITQYVCISSVYVLTSECSSLTVTLVITIRKFVSLIFSIIYFQNPFTLAHWFGTALVFVGTLIFTEIPARMLTSSDKKKKTN